MMIFLQSHSSFNSDSLVIEEDEHSIWAYWMDGEDKILMDGFLCSTGTLVESEEEVREALRKGLAPPLMNAYRNEHSIQIDLREEDIQVNWRSEGEVVVSIRKEPFLQMKKYPKASHSLALQQDGPYGHSWAKKGE